MQAQSSLMTYVLCICPCSLANKMWLGVGAGDILLDSFNNSTSFSVIWYGFYR